MKGYKWNKTYPYTIPGFWSANILFSIHILSLAPILRIHLFRVYNSQHESDIIRIEAVETERRSRLVYYRLNIFQTTTILQRYNFQSRVSN